LWPFTTTAASGINAETATNIVNGIAYPLAGNPSNFVTASITNGLGGGITESDPVWSAASNTVVYSNNPALAKADTALQPSGLRFWGEDSWDADVKLMMKPNRVDLLQNVGSEGIGFGANNGTGSAYTNILYLSGYGLGFIRARGLDTENFYQMYDSGNFLAGTHYLAPNGSGASLISLDLNPSLTATVDRAAAALTNITPAQIVAAGGVTNVSVNGSLFNVVNGVATGTVASAGGGASAPNAWDMDLTWGDLAQATTNDSVGLVSGQLSGQSIYNASNTVRYASFCTALTNTTTATASTAFTVPLGYGGTGAVFYVKQSQATNSPIIFKLNDSINTVSVTAQVTAVDTETSIPFVWPVWATNAGGVIGIQAIISGGSTNVSNVRYWGVNRKVRLQK
jgi:hypothetical protein